MDAAAQPSAIGLWGDWNETEHPSPYGLSEMYRLGADWLKDCDRVADWGCGRGWLGTLIPPDRYIGVDGSSPFAKVTADLVDYRSTVPGLFMRGVLEHNYQWAKILDNALASFTERMALVVFTPLVAETREIDFVDPPGVPDIAFALKDLLGPIEEVADCSTRTLPTATHYGQETIFYIERR